MDLVYVNASSFFVSEPPRTNLTGSTMVHYLCVPSRLDLFSGRPNRTTRLAGDDDFLDRAIANIDPVLGRQLCHVQCVAGRAKHNRRRSRLDQIESSQGRHRTGRDHQRPARGSRIEGTPKSDERTKTKCHHGSIGCRHLSGVQHVLPAFDPPLPVLGGIQNQHWMAMRTRCAMKPDVVIHRPSQIRHEWTRSIAHQVSFGSQRQLRQFRAVAWKNNFVCSGCIQQTCFDEPLPVKGVLRNDPTQHLAQAFKLLGVE